MLTRWSWPLGEETQRLLVILHHLLLKPCWGRTKMGGYHCMMQPTLDRPSAYGPYWRVWSPLGSHLVLTDTYFCYLLSTPWILASATCQDNNRWQARKPNTLVTYRVIKKKLEPKLDFCWHSVWLCLTWQQSRREAIDLTHFLDYPPPPTHTHSQYLDITHITCLIAVGM